MRCIGGHRQTGQEGKPLGRVGSYQGHSILGGSAKAEALAADTPLSFWGGFDPDNGRIIDERHPLCGELAHARALVMPAGRGSCSGSGVLLEAIRKGTAPAAIVLSRLDPIVALGAVLGDELYAKHPVILVVTESVRRSIRSGDWLSIESNGQFTIDRLGLDHRHQPIAGG